MVYTLEYSDRPPVVKWGSTSAKHRYQGLRYLISLRRITEDQAKDDVDHAGLEEDRSIGYGLGHFLFGFGATGKKSPGGVKTNHPFGKQRFNPRGGT